MWPSRPCGRLEALTEKAEGGEMVFHCMKEVYRVLSLVLHLESENVICLPQRLIMPILPFTESGLT
jgi:hypothetical protein